MLCVILPNSSKAGFMTHKEEKLDSKLKLLLSSKTEIVGSGT